MVNIVVEGAHIQAGFDTDPLVRVGVVGTDQHAHPGGLVGDVPHRRVASLSADPGGVVGEPVHGALGHAFVVVGEKIGVGGAHQHASSCAVVFIEQPRAGAHALPKCGVLEPVGRANTDAGVIKGEECGVGWTLRLNATHGGGVSKCDVGAYLDTVGIGSIRVEVGWVGILGAFGDTLATDGVLVEVVGAAEIAHPGRFHCKIGEGAGRYATGWGDIIPVIGRIEGTLGDTVLS